MTADRVQSTIQAIDQNISCLEERLAAVMQSRTLAERLTIQALVQPLSSALQDLSLLTAELYGTLELIKKRLPE